MTNHGAPDPSVQSFDPTALLPGVPAELRKQYAAVRAAFEAAEWLIVHLCGGTPPAPESILDRIRKLFASIGKASLAALILDSDLTMIRCHYRMPKIHLEGQPAPHAFRALVVYALTIHYQIYCALHSHLESARSRANVLALAETHLPMIITHFRLNAHRAHKLKNSARLRGLLLESEDEVKLIARHEWEGGKVVYPSRLRPKGLLTAMLGADDTARPAPKADAEPIASGEGDAPGANRKGRLHAVAEALVLLSSTNDSLEEIGKKVGRSRPWLYSVPEIKKVLCDRAANRKDLTKGFKARDRRIEGLA